jgi:hypothetical protein
MRRALHDTFLEGVVADTVRNDPRLSGVGVQVRFDGGVAHLSGESDPARLCLLRDVIGRLAGVCGVWDWVRTGGRAPVVLDLGVGDTKQHDSHYGVDRRAASAVDVIADVTRPLPFRSGSVDRVFAVHVLEHLPDFLPLLAECRRVLRPDGLLHVLSPWWRHVNAVADPTHVRLLDVQTIKGICAPPGCGWIWYPMHVSCDGITVFADLRPLPADSPRPTPTHLSRFFD